MGHSSWAADVPPGFVAETIATNLNAATAIAPLRDGRILIADQTGKLLVWKDGSLLDKPALTLHVTDYWERGLIGVRAHPDFPLSPYLYVLYVTDRPFVHHVLSRFTMLGNTADPSSEFILLEGDDQAKLGGKIPHGHQGGPVRFGSDGKLYVGLGEQTAGEPAQSLGTLQGKILRLNPDGSIPADNPFYTKTTGKYRAIWAYGIRNPFGLAVQPETGRMFHTEVGASAFEEVNETLRGANYGWPESEGYTKDARFKPPLYAYPPVIGRSVTGGVFYPRTNDSTFPKEWRGKFFFADWAANWVKAMDPESPTNIVTFARGLNAPVATELAPDGSLLVLNRGTIWRDGKKFAPNAGSLARIRYVGEGALAASVNKAAEPPRGTEQNALGLPASAYDLPKRFSQLDLKSKVPPPGARRRALPYFVNAPEWHAGVGVDRSIVLPAGGKIGFRAEGDWQFPPGAVFLRRYTVADGNTGIALEIRLIVTGATRGYGASYRFRPGASDGELVEDGEMVDLLAYGLPGRDRFWFVPPLDDALRTLSLSLAHAPDCNTRQLNRPGADGENQLARWNKLGLFDPPLDESQIRALPKLAAVDDSSARPELRVRSYLDVNCSVCHQPGGASRGLFDARFATPLDQAGIINGEPAAGDLGIGGAKVIAPGDPEKSILYQRLKRADQFRMPPVQFHNEPSPLVPVLEAWIKGLNSKPQASSSRE